MLGPKFKKKSASSERNITKALIEALISSYTLLRHMQHKYFGAIWSDDLISVLLNPIDTIFNSKRFLASVRLRETKKIFILPPEYQGVRNVSFSENFA